MHVCAQLLSCVQLLATPWTVAHQAPLSLEFSRQEFWSGVPFPPPGDLPNPGIKPTSLASPVLIAGFFIYVYTLLLLSLSMCVCIYIIYIYFLPH